VAAICALLTAMVSSGGITALVILLGVSIVAMHVAATLIGTRLQARSEQEQLRQRTAQTACDQPSNRASEDFVRLASIQRAPRSPWHSRGSTYLPWLPRLVVGAMIFGGVGGTVLLSGLIGDRSSVEGIVVGAASFAILGGWISFICGNFYGVFRHGFREALADQQRDQTEITKRQVLTPAGVRSSAAVPARELPSRKRPHS